MQSGYYFCMDLVMVRSQIALGGLRKEGRLRVLRNQIKIATVHHYWFLLAVELPRSRG